MKHEQSQGFSLVELMVALVVAALMAHALLSAQHYSLGLATRDQEAWNNLNYSQELMTRKGLTELSRATGTWVMSLETPEAGWRTVEQPAYLENMYWIEMDTQYRGSILQWSWLKTR